MNKRKLSSVALSLVMAVTMVLGAATMSFACTGMYFGGDTTENGSTFIGRSEDSSWKNYKKVYTVHDAEDHEEGEMYKSVSTGFEMPYPQHTYRYTLVKDATSYLTLEDEEMAQAGTNEMGVAVSGTVTLSGGKTEIVGNRRTGVTGVDPMASNGLCEEDIPSVILMQAATARQGAELLVNIYETYGAGGRDMTAIIDGKEAWVVQSLSGHTAVAVLCPSDVVGTSPNITANVPLTDDENTIISSNLYDIAEQAGTLALDENGKMLIADTYAAQPGSMSKRLYNCYLYLMGEEYADSIEAQGGQYIDYFHKPSGEKYTTYEVLRSLAYRGEGGKYYAAESAGNTIGIGNDNNLEVHMFESRKDMPAEMAIVQWESLGPVEFGVYLPGYNALITDTIEENKIGTDTMTYNYDNPELNNYRTAYFELYFLCKGRDNQDGLTVGSAEARAKYGAGVQAFWEAYQKELIAKQSVIDEQMLEILAYDKELAEQKATELNMHLQEEALGYIVTMVNELKAFESEPQEGDYVPSCMGALPTYSFKAVGGTGIPAEPAEVIEAINNLPSEISLSDEGIVEEAAGLYASMTAEGKAAVPDAAKAKLEAAKAKLESAKAKAAQAAAEAASEQAKADKEAAEAAKAAAEEAKDAADAAQAAAEAASEQAKADKEAAEAAKAAAEEAKDAADAAQAAAEAASEQAKADKEAAEAASAKAETDKAAAEKAGSFAKLAADVVKAATSGFTANKYTEDSYDAYKVAIEDAYEVLNNAEAAKADYDEADTALLKAAEGLKLKDKQPMTAKGKTITLKSKSVKKKAAKISANKAYTIKNSKGTVTFSKAKGNSKITVAMNGKITVKKGLKKGSYTIKVKVTAKGDNNHLSGARTISVKIKIK